jgi:outer membrane protein OmpA-like peptidoglycan-associated protein
VLRELAEVLKAHPEVKVRIEGHTDSKGNPQVNNWMSRERAKAVKTFLVKEGVPAARLSSVGLGFSKPIAPNTTEEGREKNRRIELVVAP